MDELFEKHEIERKELQQKIKELLKGAKKSTRNELEARAIQMEYDLKAKHNDEIDELEETLGVQFDSIVVTNKSSSANNNIKEKREEEIIQAKKAKAQKKKDKKVCKEAARNQIIEEIRSGAGPSLREIELSKLNEILFKEGLKVKDIISDGNCLYRAISDQIISKGISIDSVDLTFNGLRKVAADYIRSNAEEIAPFLEMSHNDPSFEEYCKKVESPLLSMWGGQIEIRAIANALKRYILIYCYDAPIIKMGENCDEANEPLRITFHKHYYALGEHYNSVEKC